MSEALSNFCHAVSMYSMLFFSWSKSLYCFYFHNFTEFSLLCLTGDPHQAQQSRGSGKLGHRFVRMGCVVSLNRLLGAESQKKSNIFWLFKETMRTRTRMHSMWSSKGRHIPMTNWMAWTGQPALLFLMVKFWASAISYCVVLMCWAFLWLNWKKGHTNGHFCRNLFIYLWTRQNYSNGLNGLLGTQNVVWLWNNTQTYKSTVD